MKKTLLFTLLLAAWCGLFAQHTISISLTTDRYGTETTWKVVDLSTNTTLATGGPYSQLSSNTTAVQNIPDINVDGNGCYSFTIYDSYGDGICCSYGNGSYSVSYDGVVMGSGGANFSENIHFLNATSSACPNDEIAISSVDVYSYQVLNQPFQVKGTVSNNGVNAITSYKVRYKLDGNWSAYFNVSCNLQPSGTHSFTHNLPCTISSTGHHSLVVEVSEPNGNLDQENDNTDSLDIIVNENSVPRKPLLEHFSTAQCPNCPPAHTNIHNWLSTRPEIIHLIHHCGYYTDAYTVSESQSLMVFYNDGGSTYAPAVMLDRRHMTDDPGPIFFPSSSGGFTTSLLDQERNTPAFITVNLDGSYDPSTRVLNLTVSGQLVGEIIETDPRLSVYIMEDGLVGTQSGASGSYTHDCVMRDAISGGGAWGDANVVSTTVGSTYSKTYTYTVNSSWVDENLTVIAFINNHDANDINNRAILNANSRKLLKIGTGISDNNVTRTAIYPNPATDVLNLISENEIQYVEIYNIEGQLIKSISGNVNNISISDMNDGLYFVKIHTENGTATHKFIKK